MQGFRDMVTGWLGKSVLVLVSLLLAVTGMEMYFAGGGKDIAAKVNGTEILQPQVDELAERQRQQMQAQGMKFDDINISAIRQEVLNGLITRELLVQQAKKDGYLVSDHEVYRLLREVPAFQEDGKFSQQRYEMVLRQNGENPAAYPAKAKREIAYSLLISGMNQSGFMTQAEIDHLTALDDQKRTVHIATVPAARYLKEITVTSDDVKKFYDSNASRFTTKETVELEYITLKRDQFLAKATPDENTLKERFDEKVKANAADERRKAQHILITIDSKTKESDAKKKIQDIEKRVRAGEDFATLAKEFSQDPGSVSNGGDLGFAGRGQFVPEFEKALFGLKEGEVSAPVKTEYGYHLIKLNEIEKPETLNFDTMRPQLLAEAREAAADELFNEAIDKLDAAVYEAADLKEPAEKNDLVIARTMPFGKEGDVAGLAANANVVTAAFSDEVLKDERTSQHLQLPDGSVVWIRVAQHSPARLKPLTEVGDEVHNAVLLKKAAEKAKQVAAATAKALNDGKALATVAAEQQLIWQNYENATRRTPMGSADVQQAAYRLPRPAAGKVSADSIAQDTAWLVVAVSKVEEGKPAPVAEIAQLRNVLSENHTQQEFSDFSRSLREHGKVTVKERTQQASE